MFFTDLIDALGKVAGGLKAIVNLPKAERDFRLCRSLRVALRETQTLAGKLVGAVSAKDWDALLPQMHARRSGGVHRLAVPVERG